MKTAQAFKTTDYVRLEVGAPPATGLVNQIKNPSGHLGAWGWNSVLAGSTMQGNLPGSINTTSGTLFYTTTVIAAAVTGAYGESDRYPIAVGRYASAMVRVQGALSGTTAALQVVFFDALGAQLAASAAVTWTSATAVGTILTTAPIVAPASTVRYAVRVTLTAGSSLSRSAVWDQTMLTNGATSAAVTGYAYSDPYTYTNILAGSYDVKVIRQGLSAGTLVAAIKDATLDPSVNALIRPGNPVRLMAKDALVNTWEPIYSGAVLNGTSRWVNGKVRITLNATDNAKVLANIKQAEGVATIPELRVLLEGTGTPYMVNGSNSQTPFAASVVAQNANASMLDQVAIVRDTVRGYAWINRWGAMAAYDPGSMVGTVRAALTEAHYNADIDIDFDTNRCINEVYVTLISIDAITGATIETPYGPYQDQTSIDRYGAFSETFTVQGIAPASIPAYAAAILAANAIPVRKVNELVLPILETTDFDRTTNRRAFLDLYDKVTVNNTSAAITTQPLRIAGIEHAITPTKWLMGLSFATDGGTAMPGPQPPLATLGGTTAVDLRGQRGVSTITYAAATQTQDLNILFPAGSFNAVPVVVVTCTDHRFTLAVVAVSTLSVLVRVNYTLGAVASGFSMQLHWIAVAA